MSSKDMLTRERELVVRVAEGRTAKTMNSVLESEPEDTKYLDYLQNQLECTHESWRKVYIADGGYYHNCSGCNLHMGSDLFN